MARVSRCILNPRASRSEPISLCTFAEFLAAAVENRELWPKLYERAALPAGFAERVRALPGRWHLLVLSEDWCGDSVNTVPMLQRLTEAAVNLDLRLLGRDENPDLMDAHLTGASRSIPVVMVLDSRIQALCVICVLQDRPWDKAEELGDHKVLSRGSC